MNEIKINEQERKKEEKNGIGKERKKERKIKKALTIKERKQ